MREDEARDKIRRKLPGAELSRSEGGMCHAHLALGTATRDVYAASWAELELKLRPPCTEHGEKSSW
jgi:hypothetical protein